MSFRIRFAAMAFTILPAFLSAAESSPTEPQKEVPPLINKLQDSDPLVRMKAAKSLGELGATAHAALPTLLSLKKDADEDVRNIAERAARRITDQVASEVTKMIDHLNDTDPAIRAKAAKQIGQFGPAAKNALPSLRARLKDPDPQVKNEAENAIAAISRKPITPDVQLLLNELQSPDNSTRKAAIDALASMGAIAEGALDALRQLRQDPDPAIRIAAIKAGGLIERAVADAKKDARLDAASIAGAYKGAKIENEGIRKASWKVRGQGAFGLPNFREQPAAASEIKVRQIFENAVWQFSPDGKVSVQLTLPAGWQQGLAPTPRITLSGPTEAEKNERFFSLDYQGMERIAMVSLRGSVALHDDCPFVTCILTITGANTLEAVVEQNLEPAPSDLRKQ